MLKYRGCKKFQLTKGLSVCSSQLCHIWIGITSINIIIIVIITWTLVFRVIFACQFHVWNQTCSKPNIWWVICPAPFSAVDVVSWDSGINKLTSNMESAPFISLTNIHLVLKLESIHWDLALYYLLWTDPTIKSQAILRSEFVSRCSVSNKFHFCKLFCDVLRGETILFILRWLLKNLMMGTDSLLHSHIDTLHIPKTWQTWIPYLDFLNFTSHKLITSKCINVPAKCTIFMVWIR